MKSWEEGNNDSFADTIKAVVQEGLDRTFFDKIGVETEKALAWSQKCGLSRKAATHLDTFHHDIYWEIVELAAVLGYALAMVPASLISHDEWLAAALSKSGLHKYELHPSMRFEAEESDILQRMQADCMTH